MLGFLDICFDIETLSMIPFLNLGIHGMYIIWYVIRVVMAGLSTSNLSPFVMQMYNPIHDGKSKKTRNINNVIIN